MAECTGKDLRTAREAQNLARWQLGEAVGVSEDTINRWETGKTNPTPEDVDRIGDALNDTTLWHRWMLSNCDSYRKRYMGVENYQLLPSVMRTGIRMEDIAELQKRIERDALDGKLDNPSDKARYREELKHIIACATDTMQNLG